MNCDYENPIEKTSARQTFVLIDELPGPPVADAADHLEQLGIDPWQFDDILPIDHFADGKMIAVTFAVFGPRPLLDALNKASQKHLAHSS